MRGHGMVRLGAVLSVLLVAAAAADGVPGDREARIRALAAGERAGAALERLYAHRGHRLLWHTDDGRWSPAARAAVAALREAATHGLSPADYRAPGLAPAAGDPLVADVALSAALLALLQDLGRGRFEPRRVDPDWHIPRPEIDAAATLAAALGTGTVMHVADRVAPAADDYALLRDALARLREVQRAGGWPLLPRGPSLHPGDRAEWVPLLRRRLAVDQGTDPLAYDAPLVAAVRGFQRRHGLTVDGVVGPRTRAALNVPVAERITQVRVNLERWRWLPRALGRRHVLVNTAGFVLEAVEDGRVVLEMPVIVGRHYRQTPSFASRITHLVANPYWNVPRSIAVQDILPKVRNDPGYLRRRHLRVFVEDAGGRREVDPDAIDWRTVDARHFPYHLRQDPGPDNALGRLKFLLPNDFAIYLHDTPERGLFARGQRAFSSGCIRLADPLALAGFVLDDPARLEALEAVVDSGRNYGFPVPRPVPVWVVYLTAWARDDGLHLAEDIYRRDVALARAWQAVDSGVDGVHDLP